MSFADELRKSPAAPAYRLDVQLLNDCVEGIKDACRKNRTTGHLSGYLQTYNDDGYFMGWRVVPDIGHRLDDQEVNRVGYKQQKIYRPSSGTLYHSFDMGVGNDPIFKAELQKRIQELGFKSFVLKTVSLEQEKQTIWAGAFGRYHEKYEKTGKMIHALYVDIRW